MIVQTIAKVASNLRRAFIRYCWIFVLAALMVWAALTMIRFVSEAQAAPIARSTPQTMPVNPAQQAVFDYLWAHRSNPPLQAPTTMIDPAQQSVMNYLHAHERVAPPPFWDQAAQAVRDYLRAHSR